MGCFLFHLWCYNILVTANLADWKVCVHNSRYDDYDDEDGGQEDIELSVRPKHCLGGGDEILLSLPSVHI